MCATTPCIRTNEKAFLDANGYLPLEGLFADQGEFNNVADEPVCQDAVRELVAVLDKWIEETDDFPSQMRRRDDNTDRITGVKFTQKIPPMWNE